MFHTDKCRECGCVCNSCSSSTNNLDFHHEIEELKAKLNTSNGKIENLNRLEEEDRRVRGSQLDKLKQELDKHKDKFDRLLESYKKSQKLNHDLEDKMLTMVQKHENEHAELKNRSIELNSKLMDAKFTISDLEQECERYRNDCFTAAQLLQCKPSNFVSHKLNTLPLDVQQRVKVHLTREEIMKMEYDVENPPVEQTQKVIRVHMPTFPPTAMVYSVNADTTNSTDQRPLSSRYTDSVPTDLIAKVLCPSDSKQRPSRFYVCNNCNVERYKTDRGTQTLATTFYDNGYCLRTAMANMKTNPPTIIPHYPGVHAQKSRLSSMSSDMSPP